jgi:hypothetical protein
MLPALLRVDYLLTGTASNAVTDRRGREAVQPVVAVSGLAAFGIRVAEADMQFHWRNASI